MHFTTSELLKIKQPTGQRPEESAHALLWALETGGGERDRTDDPLLAKQVLSQLSYTPYTHQTGGSGWI